MSKKEYYVIIAKEGGDRDISYYIFENKDYFEAFIKCNDAVNLGDDDSVARLIKKYKEDGLFDWITEQDFKAFIELDNFINSEDDDFVTKLIKKYKEDGLFDWITEQELEDMYIFEDSLAFFNKTFINCDSTKELIKLTKDGTIVSEAEILIL